MNILMVLDHEFPPDVRVENEAMSLIKAGHRLHLACYTRQGRAHKDIYNGMILHRIPVSTLIYKSSVAALTVPLYIKFWERFLDKVVRENAIEAIHIHDLPLARVGKILKYRYNLKLVIDLHENWPVLLDVSTHTKTITGRILSPRFLWVRYEKRILKHADSIIAIVRESKERLEKLGLDGSKIFIVSNTLNIKEFGFTGGKPDPRFFTLYYAGGITYHRGLQTVLKAIYFIREKIPQIRFRIAGSGKYAEKLKEQAKELNIVKHIEFLGHLPLKEVAANLAMADAAMIPHLKTDHAEIAMPHKLFQYMYANKPVISSDCKLMDRLITETNAGLIFKAGSAEDLAEKLLALYENKVTVSPARNWVEKKYNWDVDARTLVSMYEKLMIEIASGR